MKTLLSVVMCLSLPWGLYAALPDSVYVRPVGLPQERGMTIEYSANDTLWATVTGTVLGSDYGPWDSEKRLYNPSWTIDKDGKIVLVFQVNDRNAQFAVTTTMDLIHWRPQDYPFMEGVGECLSPTITYADGKWSIVFHNRKGEFFTTTTTDVVHFTPPVKISPPAETEQALRLPYTMIERLVDHLTATAAREKLYNERAAGDSLRFRDLTSVAAQLTIDPSATKPISNRLMGVFFEDINYAADGGLWAELLQNGDFEYDPAENIRDDEWGIMKGWAVHGTLTVDSTAQGVTAANAHAVRLTIANEQLGASLRNTGYAGIPVKEGATYDLSLYTHGVPVKVSIVADNKILASTTVDGTETWTKTMVPLCCTATADSAQLAIEPLQTGSVSIDMVSLMPQDTYKGHGLRRDLAETIAALHPRFMRFPGGCLAHGDGLDNIYHWKETIGPVEERQGRYNIWRYHQSRRLGFYELFQMCEDMGMLPLPVLAAGVPCQNSDGTYIKGQQGGIPLEGMDDYIQEVLDLIEWANGDVQTTWGARRAAQGHPAPFHLTMIGIGNEDLVSPTFIERYLMICRAVKERYPEIEICGTAGPFYCGADYDEGWRVATMHSDIIDMVDEHYYLPPAWYIYNQHFYDHYDRHAPRVYLGEWAAHVPSRASTIESALAEALYFCSIERNGDVVTMSSYAPLLAREGYTQWNPDMIYFDGTAVHPTVGYYAHAMCGAAQGDIYMPTALTTTPTTMQGVQERLAASCVVDSTTGQTYIKMVNLLPVAATVDLTAAEPLASAPTCHVTTLTGAYDSTAARPITTLRTLTPHAALLLPPYSFTVIAF